MDNRNLVIQSILFIIYMGLQVIFMKNVVLFDKAFCFVYVAFLLLIPLEAGALLIMFLGFITGLITDIFYDSLGIHASSCVIIMFLRPYLVNLLTPRGGYDAGLVPTLRVMGWEWFGVYAYVLIFIHHLALFYIEASGFRMFFFTFSKAFFSSILTFTVVVIIQYLFYAPRRSL
ncbi:MAG: Rod shape-determining protein MreD [Cytophagales bacterium]|nr:Rod shape-determining protein MreD [Cytophagales bacterium]